MNKGACFMYVYRGEREWFDLKVNKGFIIAQTVMADMPLKHDNCQDQVWQISTPCSF